MKKSKYFIGMKCYNDTRKKNKQIIRQYIPLMPHGHLSMIMQCKRYLINLTTLAWNLRGGTQPVIGIQ